MIEFNNAVEASNVLGNLRVQARTISYNKDIFKLIKNAEQLVGKLGTAEVRARQTHNYRPTEKVKEELEEALKYIEKILIIAKLME